MQKLHPAKEILTVLLIVQVFYLTNIHPFTHPQDHNHFHALDATECCNLPECLDVNSSSIPEVHFHHGCGPDCHQQRETNHVDPDSYFLVNSVISKLNLQVLSIIKTPEVVYHFEEPEFFYAAILDDRIPSVLSFRSSLSHRGPPSHV